MSVSRREMLATSGVAVAAGMLPTSWLLGSQPIKPDWNFWFSDDPSHSYHLLPDSYPDYKGSGTVPKIAFKDIKPGQKIGFVQFNVTDQGVNVCTTIVDVKALGNSIQEKSVVMGDRLWDSYS